MLIALYAILALILLLTILGWNKGVPVLLYHQVHAGSSTTPAAFEKELQWLKEQGYITYTISEWYEKKKLPSKSIIITFDDGYYDNYLYVFPLLKKYNMKATFFLNTAYLPVHADRSKTIIDNSPEAIAERVKRLYITGDGASEQYMSYDEIREMQASGLCDFQAHSHAHRVAFKKPEFIRYVESAKRNADDYHAYGAKVEDGFPMFRTRGETSIRAFIPHEYYARSVQEMLKEEWHELLEWQQRVEAAAFGVAAELKDMGRYETDEEFRARVRKEIAINREEVAKITGVAPHAYAWPYGHHSQQSLKFIEEEGIQIFLTCKKGTNASSPDWKKIRRIELRKPTLKKFSFVVSANSHPLSGFLFGLFS